MVWNYKEFKLNEEQKKDNFIKKLDKNNFDYQEIFINNGYGVEYSKQREIKFK